jgi:hypothetical protein
MPNSFSIPHDIEEYIRQRDKKCVYCGCKMREYPHTKGVPKDKATIEHLSENGPFYWNDGLKKEDFAICCGSCNSSRGRKRLNDWFTTAYCIKRKINIHTVSQPVKVYLKKKNRNK